MIDVKNIFGGLDLDTSPYLLPKDKYIDALNITRDAVSGSNDLAATNIIGSRKVSYSLPAGTCKVIGAREDRLRNYIYYMVWNSNSLHSVLRYNNTTRTTAKVIESKTDSGGVDILGFTEHTKINHIEIFHRDEGDIIFWSDGVTSPKGFDVENIIAGTYGTLELAFIEAAKRPPLAPPIVAYGNDATKAVNALRKKLYQIKYRWVYDDYSKSTWSPISVVPIPAGIVGTDADLDATKNNFISVTLNSGGKNVSSIEVAVRISIGAIWGDFFLADSLSKTTLSISHNSEYVYNFYSDGVYPAIDIVESNLLFDWFPQLAKAMVLVNGNTLVFGAITEGFDRLSTLNVTMSVANVTNTSQDLGAPSLTYSQSVNTFTFTVTGNVPTGTRYRVIAMISSVVTTLSDYTSLVGNTISDVATGIYNSTSAGYRISNVANQYQLNLPAGSTILQILVYPGASSGTTINSASTYNWFSRYLFGIVYFDEQGRTDGVVRNSSMFINTPAFSTSGGVPQTPVISASINHTPPTWAVKYQWVRTPNIAFNSFIYYVTCDFQSDTDYYYFCLQNVKYFFDINNKFIYDQIVVNEGDRIRVVADATSSGYNATLWNQDYEILGLVERQLTGGSSTDLGMFAKVKKPIAAPSPVYNSEMLVLVYTPAQVSSLIGTQVYYEFGEAYDIYTSGASRYHRGKLQDQTGAQAATFEFINGDAYYKQRKIYYDIVSPVGSYDYLIMDSNYSDYFSSAVNSNGRVEVEDINSKRQYFPTLVRHGQSYIPDTNVNGFNRFYFENMDEYNRSFGDILKLAIRDNYMKVGQKYKIGNVPVLLQIVKNASGDNILSVTDRLLNQIMYYNGEYGVGESPESWTSYNFADYFCDTNRGVICRLSQDGITPISILYKVNSWANEKLPLRIGNNKIYGAYDPKTNNYIIALEAAGSDPSATLSFDEESNSFESFLSYKPEMMCVLGTLLVTFKDGELWTHDSSSYNNFYGVQYDSTITTLFNESALQKKTFVAISQISSSLWDCPLIYTDLMSYGSQRQESNLVASDFQQLEGTYEAALYADQHSIGGISNGDSLKGKYLAVKFRKQNASSLISLNLVSAKNIISQLTTV